MLAALRPELAQHVLAETVARGPCVDGVLGQQVVSVDGLNATAQDAVLRKMLAVVEAVPAGELDR
jgi:hypothetical protein